MCRRLLMCSMRRLLRDLLCQRLAPGKNVSLSPFRVSLTSRPLQTLTLKTATQPPNSSNNSLRDSHIQSHSRTLFSRSPSLKNGVLVSITPLSSMSKSQFVSKCPDKLSLTKDWRALMTPRPSSLRRATARAEDGQPLTRPRSMTLC